MSSNKIDYIIECLVNYIESKYYFFRELHYKEVFNKC